MGERSSVRRMTFRSFGTAVVVGYANPDVGGYRVTDCTFLDSFVPVDASHATSQVTRISRNRFVNVLIPFKVLGDRFEISWNRITAPDPSRIPIYGTPGRSRPPTSASWVAR